MKMTISGEGGRFCFGTIENYKDLESIIKLRKNKTLSIYNFKDENNVLLEKNIAYNDFNNIYDIEGPHKEDTKFFINNKEIEIENFSFILFERFDLTKEQIERNKEEGVIGYLGGGELEQGHFFEYEIKEEMEYKDFYFLCYEIDKTLHKGEIICDVIYIGNNKEYIKIYNYVKKEKGFENWNIDKIKKNFEKIIIQLEKNKSYEKILEKYLLKNIGKKHTIKTGEIISFFDYNFKEH